MKPLPHQEKYGNGYKDKAFLVHEGGTGKTVCACLWLKDGRDKDALVICPKRVVKKWSKTLSDWGTKATVLSKEEFKKTTIKKWSAIVVDEADEFASPLFISKKRSDNSTALYELILAQPETPIILLTATPIRSTSWNLHTLLCFLGIYIDWKAWRKEFFSLEKRPYLARLAWLPKPDWRERARFVLEKYADIVLLKDCVDEVPAVRHEIISVPFTKIKQEEWEVKSGFFAEHKNEQSDKLKKVLEISKDYRKILVVAYYVEQVEKLSEELSKYRQTFMVHGGVKNQEDILKKANEDTDECFLVIQASLGSAFDADSFSCVIFVSMSYAVRDYAQMKFRVRRIHNLHPVIYYYLIAGRCDKAVYNNIQLGRDFTPSEWEATNAS